MPPAEKNGEPASVRGGLLRQSTVPARMQRTAASLPPGDHDDQADGSGRRLPLVHAKNSQTEAVVVLRAASPGGVALRLVLLVWHVAFSPIGLVLGAAFVASRPDVRAAAVDLGDVYRRGIPAYTLTVTCTWPAVSVAVTLPTALRVMAVGLVLAFLRRALFSRNGGPAARRDGPMTRAGKSITRLSSAAHERGAASARRMSKAFASGTGRLRSPLGKGPMDPEEIYQAPGPFEYFELPPDWPAGESTPPVTWARPNPSSFSLRSKTYLTSRIKEPSPEPFTRFIGIDMFDMDRKVYNVCGSGHLRLKQPVDWSTECQTMEGVRPPPGAAAAGPGDEADKLPEVLVVSFLLPFYAPSASSLFSDPAEDAAIFDGEGGAVVLYFAVPPYLGITGRVGPSGEVGPPSESAILTRRWLLEAVHDEYVRNKVKMIARCENVDEMDMPPVAKHQIRKHNSTPVLLRPKLTFFRGSCPHSGVGYLEMVIDLHIYTFFVRKILSTVLPTIQDCCASAAWTIEGTSPSELPEVLMAAAMWSKFDWTNLRAFPPRPARSRSGSFMAGARAGPRGRDAGPDDGGSSDDDQDEAPASTCAGPSETAPIGAGPSSIRRRRSRESSATNGRGAHDALESVLPQVRELEAQGAYSAASELLAAALVESKRMQDRLWEMETAGRDLARPESEPIASVERLKPVSMQTHQFRGRLHVLSRRVNMKVWRGRFCVLEGSTLRVHRQRRDGRLSRPLMVKVGCAACHGRAVCAARRGSPVLLSPPGPSRPSVRMHARRTCERRRCPWSRPRAAWSRQRRPSSRSSRARGSLSSRALMRRTPSPGSRRSAPWPVRPHCSSRTCAWSRGPGLCCPCGSWHRRCAPFVQATCRRGARAAETLAPAAPHPCSSPWRSPGTLPSRTMTLASRPTLSMKGRSHSSPCSCRSGSATRRGCVEAGCRQSTLAWARGAYTPPPPLCADGSPRAPFPPSALLARNQAQVGRVLGNYTADGPGVLIICWDNTYSVLTSKTISYRVTKEPRL